MANGRRASRILSAALTGGLLALPALAPAVTFSQGDKSLSVGGQLRIRHQSPPRPMTDDLVRFTNYRARLNFDFQLGDSLRIFLQPQKVGVFGDNDTGASVDFARTPANQTLHQAYLDWRMTESLELRLGRFEQALADHRIVGTFGWSQRARSFDGGRLQWHRNGHQVSIYGVTLAGDLAGATGGGLPAGDANADQEAFIAHYRTANIPDHRLELTYLFDDDPQGVGGSASSLGGGPVAGAERHTAGFFLARTSEAGRYLSLFPGRTLGYIQESGPYWRVEGYYQAGDRFSGQAQNVSAFMGAAYLGYSFAEAPMSPLVWGGVDYLSGDSNPGSGDFGAFETPYATNHPYYGMMDYFFISPVADTGGFGLRDAHLSIHAKPMERLGIFLTGHDFALADDPGGTSSHLGNEVDLTVAYRATEYVSLLAGYSRFFTGDGMVDLGRISAGEDPQFMYGQINVSF